MKVADRPAPLGPHKPVEAVARAEVRAGALPVLDDPREAGLRRDARIDRAAIWSAMMVTQPPCRSRCMERFQRWWLAGAMSALGLQMSLCRLKPDFPGSIP